jgi:TPR repeat protein
MFCCGCFKKETSSVNIQQGEQQVRNQTHTMSKVSEAGSIIRNDPEAIYQQGLEYKSKGNDLAAFDCFFKAAMAAHNQAKFELGMCYHEGRGNEQDTDLARVFLTQAAEAGISEAKKKLTFLTSSKGSFIVPASDNMKSLIVPLPIEK